MTYAPTRVSATPLLHMPTQHSHLHVLSRPLSPPQTHLISCRPVCCSLLPTIIHQLGQAGEGGLSIVVQYSWPLSSDHQPIDVRHVLDLIKWTNTSSQLIEEHGKCKDIHLERYTGTGVTFLKKSISYMVPLIHYNTKSSLHKTQLIKKSQHSRPFGRTRFSNTPL